MPGQQKRKKSVRQKLNAMSAEFKNKNVLIVDDSIVRVLLQKKSSRWLKMQEQIKFFTSCTVRFPHVYGINMPNRDELIAYDRTISEIVINCKLIILFIKVLKI